MQSENPEALYSNGCHKAEFIVHWLETSKYSTMRLMLFQPSYSWKQWKWVLLICPACSPLYSIPQCSVFSLSCTISMCIQDMLTAGLRHNRRTLNDVTTACGQLAVDTELPVSAESDADAGNCSASDSGRGLSYEAFTDEMGVRSQTPRTHGRSTCDENKLRAHMTAIEAANSDIGLDRPQGIHN